MFLIIFRVFTFKNFFHNVYYKRDTTDFMAFLDSEQCQVIHFARPTEVM